MTTTPADDPVYVHSRREALIILLVWAASFAWTVPYCYLNGFQTAQQNWQLELTWGMPSWVIWGIALPWFVAGVVSIAICLFYMKDDDLGPDDDDVFDRASEE